MGVCLAPRVALAPRTGQFVARRPDDARRRTRRTVTGAVVGAVAGLGASVALHGVMGEAGSPPWYRDRPFYRTAVLFAAAGAAVGAGVGTLLP